MKCPVDRCNGETNPGWTVCRPCAADLEQTLAEIPALAGELDATLARCTARGGTNSARSVLRALPYDPRASEAVFVLRSALVGWTRDLEPELERQIDDDVAAMARWLLARLDRLVVHPAADEIVDELTAASTQAWRCVDRPPDRTFLGRCGCGADLYALDSRTDVRCRTCGASHDAEANRAAAVAQLDDMLVTAAEFAGVTVHLGIAHDRERTRNLVNVWATRGRIVAHNAPDGPRYRFGELRARIDEITARNV